MSPRFTLGGRYLFGYILIVTQKTICKKFVKIASYASIRLEKIFKMKTEKLPALTVMIISILIFGLYFKNTGGIATTLSCAVTFYAGFLFSTSPEQKKFSLSQTLLISTLSTFVIWVFVLIFFVRVEGTSIYSDFMQNEIWSIWGTFVLSPASTSLGFILSSPTKQYVPNQNEAGSR